MALKFTALKFTALKSMALRSIAFVLFSIMTLNVSAIDNKNYHRITLEGRAIHIEKTLVDNNDPRVFPVLRVLGEKLREVKKLLPKHHYKTLENVPIWISKNSGEHAEFYFFERRIYKGERNPDMLNGIEFQNIDNLLEHFEQSPMLVIHELAHAFHKINYEDIDEQIMDAFNNARWENLYEDLKLGRDLTRYKMYASHSPFEYFSELTEAYFGINDYFPHSRKELRKHDPVGYKMIKSIWR